MSAAAAAAAAAANAAATSSAEVGNPCKTEGVFEGGGLLTKTIKEVGFSMSPTRLGEAEINPLVFRANSATFNAPCRHGARPVSRHAS